MTTQTSHTTNDRQAILASLGLVDLPEQEQDELIAKVSQVLFEAILDRSMPYLSEEEMKELTSLFEKNAEFDEVIDWLDLHVLDFERIFKEEGSKLHELLTK